MCPDYAALAADMPTLLNGDQSTGGLSRGVIFWVLSGPWPFSYNTPSGAAPIYYIYFSPSLPSPLLRLSLYILAALAIIYPSW